MEVSDGRRCRQRYMREILSAACLYITTTDGVFLCRGPEKATSLLDASSLRPDEVGRREPFRGEQRPTSARPGCASTPRHLPCAIGVPLKAGSIRPEPVRSPAD